MSGPPSLNLQITSDYEETSFHAEGFNTGLAIFRPKVSANTVFLGDHAQTKSVSLGPVGSTVVAEEDDDLLAPPTGYTRVWTSQGGPGLFSIWAPLAPSGYVSLGCVAAAGIAEPVADQLRCVQLDVAKEIQPGPFLFYTVASGPVTVYPTPGIGTFQAQSSLPQDEDSPEGSEFKATPASVQTWIPRNL